MLSFPAGGAAFLSNGKRRLFEAALYFTRENCLLLVFALLVCNAAGSLASGLARGLAFAAAAVVDGLNDVLGFDGLDSSHGMNLHMYILMNPFDVILTYL